MLDNVNIFLNTNLDIYENMIDKQISKNYEASLKNIYAELSKIFIDFAQDGVLTYDNMLKFDRLIKFEKTLLNEVNALFGNEYDIIFNTLRNTYQNSYLIEAYNILKESSSDIQYSLIPLEQVKEAIEMPISGLKISDRVIKNKQDTFLKLKEIITSNLIQGGDVKKISKQISQTYDISKAKSMRIARTEVNRIRNAGTNRSYEEAKKQGIEFEKMWMATLDKKTRDAHKKLDGQFADKDGYFHFKGYKTQVPGNFGVASLDINCRCTTKAVFEGIGNNKRKDNTGNKKIVEYKNYEDWAKSLNKSTK